MKHNIDEVLFALKQKNDVFVDGRVIKVLSDKIWDKKLKADVPNPKKRNDLGNGSWGKIDYLQKMGYRQIFVSQF